VSRPSAPALTRLRAPALLGLGVLAAVALLHVRDPHAGGSYAYCPWLLLTGTYCPGCGGLRAVYDLTHGDLAAAASSNLLLIALLPVAVLAWTAWARARWRGYALSVPLYATRAAWAMLVVVPAFGLLRNQEFASWLAP
jgi:Protein of unknown function (DUF2752)